MMVKMNTEQHDEEDILVLMTLDGAHLQVVQVGDNMMTKIMMVKIMMMMLNVVLTCKLSRWGTNLRLQVHTIRLFLKRNT